MKSPDKFFVAVRSGLLGPDLSQSEVDGCNAILAAAEGLPISYAAYMLATAYLETAHTMQPIKEMGGDAYFFRRYDPKGNRPDIAARLGNTQPGDGVKYCGRGYPQMTGRGNYTKADAALAKAGLIKPGELIANPDLAMRPDIAAFIMRWGMTLGTFTGKRLSDYLPNGLGNRAQFREARRIINGQDRADEIADYACQFQAALQAGGWE